MDIFYTQEFRVYCKNYEKVLQLAATQMEFFVMFQKKKKKYIKVFNCGDEVQKFFIHRKPLK